jgi:CheY-like chemotaxis protein
MKTSFKGLTALVVEDDWLLRETIVDALQEIGWTVLEAASGASALTVLREVSLRRSIFWSPTFNLLTRSPGGISPRHSEFQIRRCR